MLLNEVLVKRIVYCILITTVETARESSTVRNFKSQLKMTEPPVYISLLSMSLCLQKHIYFLLELIKSCIKNLYICFIVFASYKTNLLILYCCQIVISLFVAVILDNLELDEDIKKLKQVSAVDLDFENVKLGIDNTVKSWYFKCYLKLLISQSKLFGHRKFYFEMLLV